MYGETNKHAVSVNGSTPQKKRSHPIPVVKKEELNCPAKGVGEAPGKGHKPVPDDLQGGEALLLPNRHNPLHLEAGWLHSLQCF